MKLLFIISGSITAKKNTKILSLLTLNEINVDCIITEKAKKLANKVEKIKKEK
tara:strand:- start:164 stop:322 length:159 start_codon:yes stop_codon:yes gene_type:complete